MSNFEPGSVASFGFDIIYKCKEGFLFKEDVNLADQRYAKSEIVPYLSVTIIFFQVHLQRGWHIHRSEALERLRQPEHELLPGPAAAAGGRLLRLERAAGERDGLQHSGHLRLRQGQGAHAQRNGGADGGIRHQVPVEPNLEPRKCKCGMKFRIVEVD